MQLKILIDNTPSSDPRLASEHGLSLYFEVDGQRFLLDTGLTGRAFDNAALMGIDVSSIDRLILSHGHVDHTGGLATFLSLNQRAQVYVSRRVLCRDYTSTRRGREHSLSPDARLFVDHAQRFTFVDDTLPLTAHLSLVCCHDHPYATPSGNRYLHVAHVGSGVREPYRADDELSVVISSRPMVILSPCSHHGLLNILNACCPMPTQSDAELTSPAICIVGGLHLLDEEAALDNVSLLAQHLATRYPQLRIFTGHCTGPIAVHHLSSILSDRLTRFSTGDAFSL